MEVIVIEDVKDNNVPEAQPVEETTEQQVPQPEQPTPEVPETQTVTQEATERMVPLSVVKEERRKRQELQRKVAELEGSQKLKQFEGDDLESVMSHPFVQELLQKQTKQELTDFANDLMGEYPKVHPTVKKAILKNVRGFVNETTTDVETAKLDLREYIESIVEDNEPEAQTPTTPKTFQVAATNVSQTTVPGVRPADVQKILEKPVDEWTDEESEVVETYAKSQK